jgi:ABC-type multidrug transport system fused ATPase/permease subunit
MLSFISITFSAVAIFILDWRLGVVSLGIGFLALLIQYRFASPLSHLNKERLQINAGTVNDITSFISGGSSIRAFGLQDQLSDAFDKDIQDLRSLSYQEAGIMTWQNVFSNMQSWLSMAGIFGIGGFLVVGGYLELPVLLMVPTLSANIARGMSTIGRAWAGMQGPLAACERLCGILDQSNRLNALATEVEKTPSDWDGDYTLTLNNVDFSYLNAEKNTLEEINLSIEKNEMVAFVGRSGCGKSTLLRLIIGLYERSNIPMSIGTLDFSSTPAEHWRDKFAYVDQSCTLFNMSIADNIALGKPGCTREEIEQAAKEAGAHQFIISLPEGYETLCGDRGSALSASQKQRIAIARALVRQAPILVFDEATSMLDAENAAQLMQTIAELRRNHTVLIVTHYLEQIEDADRIIVIEQGRIVEEGSHEDLLIKGGEYARLRMQN